MRELQADRGTPLTRPSDVDPSGADPGEVDPGGADPNPAEDGAAQAAASAAGETSEPGPPADSEPAPPEVAEAAEPATAGGDDPASGDPAPQLPVRRRRTLFAVIALITLAADIVSKLAVVAKLENPGHAPIKVVPHVLYLIHTRNTGAAFSLGTSYTFLLTLVAVGVIVFIVRTARRLVSPGWAVALGLVLGGACGNVVDRLFRSGGGVIDFLALGDPYKPVWPVFNLADSALCCGVALLVLLEFTGRRIDGTRATQAKVRNSKDD